MGFFCTLGSPLCSVTRKSHVIYSAVSEWPINRNGVISFFETPQNLSISFADPFSRGFKRISSTRTLFTYKLTTVYFSCIWVLRHCHIVHLICFKIRFVYGNFNNDVLSVISSAHKFGACTNVSCDLSGLSTSDPPYEYFTFQLLSTRRGESISFFVFLA